MRTWALTGLLVGGLLLGGGLLAGPAGAEPEEAESAPAAEGGVHDPWEGYNRAIFRFNEGVSRFFSEPVAQAWDFVVPDPLRRGLRNVFVNIAFPIRVVNTTLQLKPLETGQEIARFLTNVTFGLGGLFDPASYALNLPMNKEDFGQTLGYWGVPPGPYFMLPIFGPSTVRDTFGLAGDVAVSVGIFSAAGVSLPFFATFAAQAGSFINQQSFVVDDIKRERETSVDFYASVRNAYIQFRENRIADREYDEEPAELDDDLYYFEEFEEEASPAGAAATGGAS